MELDPPRTLLLQLITQAETDLATVSRGLKRNHAYLQQYIKSGKPRALPEDVREALGVYFHVDPDRFRADHLRKVGGNIVRGEDSVTLGGHEYAMLPTFDLRLSAGPGAWTGDESDVPVRWEPYRLQWIRSITHAAPERLMLATVDGDSMEPTLRTGDQVLIDRSRTIPNRDGVYAFRRGEELQVKRVSVEPTTGRLTLISDNRAYRDYPDINPDELQVIGLVIWLGRIV